MKKNTRIYIIVIATILSLSVKVAQAQQELTLHYMNNLYQSSKTNPAFQSNNKFAFQFVNFYFNFYNTGFRIKDLSDATKQEQPGNYIINKLQDVNYHGNIISTDLFSFHFKVKTFDFSFNATQNITARLGYPKDLFALAYFGNGDDYFLAQNRAATFDGLGADVMAYTEFGIGMSQIIKEKFTYGVKYKFLVGDAVLNTANSKGSLYTDPGDYSITGSANILINTANVPDLNNLGGSKSNYAPLDVIKRAGNRGHAVDFGASYKVTSKLTINASVINLGYIDWKDSVRNYSTNGSLKFSGVEIANLGKSIDSLNFNKFIDTAKKVFKLKDTQNSFRTRLSPLFYFSATYNFNPKNKVGVLVSSEYFNNETFRNAYVVGYTKTFGRALDIGLTYSIQNRNYLNFGVGAALRFLCFESYFVTDNILGFAYPALANSYNFRIGTNIIFGRDGRKIKVRDKDKDGILDNVDLCPTVAGVASAKGCPDMDNDSIPDSQDSCKTVAGLKQFNGCPDTDGDGIPDRLDHCPTEFGLAIFQGCPDTDGDSIPDREDSCRTVKGLKQFHGCPDSDGDGIEDSKDACPNLYGPIIFNGCPDSDGDSIPDNKDDCPTVKGVKENNGCPKAAPTRAQLTVEEEEVINKVFSNLEFENGKATIKASSFPALEALSALLIKKPSFKLNVFGYTDNVGSKAANMKLSKQRAEAIKTYLTGKGIDGSRIAAEGFGPENPIASNKTPQGRAKNRRVEFTILE